VGDPDVRNVFVEDSLGFSTLTSLAKKYQPCYGLLSTLPVVMVLPLLPFGKVSP
jgi:uncharacterized BrkB/YihY/UPF0761 family membrane protein